ncbi:MAG: hemerythrin domain-containing protein [Firmicutes bacterium]|nr:hemerythrin domain-containing protein [Bacillota bacterium]
MISVTDYTNIRVNYELKPADLRFPSAEEVAYMPNNRHFARAIAAHHAEMVKHLERAVRDLAQAMEEQRPWAPLRDALCRYADGELLPHAAAEESTLYARARDNPVLVPLIEAMLAEHRSLRQWRDRIQQASQAVDALVAGGALSGLFAEHAAKEEHQLLPALVRRADVDLGALLGALQDELVGRQFPPDHRL